MREGFDPMGGDNSPMKVPGLRNISPDKLAIAAQRSTSPKKLLHKVKDLNSSPMPGSNQS